MCKSISVDHCGTAGPKLEVLYKSPAGSLCFCPACRTFGVTFGTLHLSLDPKALLAFSRLLEQLSDVELEDGQCHMVRLGGSSASLILEKSDLAGFQHIVLQGCQTAIGAQAGIDAAPSASAQEAWVH